MILIPQITNSGYKGNRLFVEPMAERTRADVSKGIFKPLSAVLKKGIVKSATGGGEFVVGDIVEYHYPEEGKDYSIEHNKEVFDLIYESEVCIRNGEPTNVLFVEPLSKFETTEEGIAIPLTTKGITQKGKIISAPKESGFEEGKTIEYRKTEEKRELYFQVLHKGIVCDVLFPHHVLKYRGNVCGSRLLIKFDLKEQVKKRTKADSGVFVPPMYRYMLYNLQYGVIDQMGPDAKEVYPELNVGDTVICHHTIEQHPHTLMEKDASYEWRLTNNYAPHSRDVFAKMSKDKLGTYHINPIGRNIFATADIYPFEETVNPQYDSHKIGGIITTLSNYTILLAKRAETANEAYKAQMMQLNYNASKIPPDDTDENRQLRQDMEAELTALNNHKRMVDIVLKKNYLVMAKSLSGEWVITTYKEIYPLEIKGTTYLAIYKDFIVLTSKSANMPQTLSEFQLMGDRLLVKRITEAEEGGVIRPEQSLPQTQKGTVVKIGDGDNIPKNIAEGDTIIFETRVGTPLMIEDVDYLVVNGRTDIIGKL